MPTFKVRAYVKAATEVIGEALQEGDKIELENLGAFKLLRLPERTVSTNLGNKKQTIKLPASVTPDFEVSPDLRTSVKPTPAAEVPASEPIATTKIADLHNAGSNVEFVELNGKTIPKTILALIPQDIAKKYLAVPFALEDKTLSVAMTDPENEEAFSAIRKISGKILKPFITTEEDVNYILDQYQALQTEMKALIDSDEADDVSTLKDEEESKTDDDEIDETSPAAKIISTLLKRSVREKASDIHIEPSEEEVQVRFRIDGVLHKILSLPKEIQSSLTSRTKILANLKIDETRLPQDGRIQILLDGNKIDSKQSPDDKQQGVSGKDDG